MVLVSAIVTTCTRDPNVVCRAINSILLQTYSSIEIIVVDDSPADFLLRNDVKRAVCCLSDKIVYLQNEEQRGACYSRNRGIFVANGEYIAFLDDDDEWLPRKIEEQLNLMAAFPENVAMLYGNFYLYDDEKQTQRMITLEKHEGEIFDELMASGNFCGGMSTPIIKTTALKSVGGFDVEMASGQDFDLWLRLAKNYSIRYYPEPLTVYHWHQGEQITKNTLKRIQGSERLFEKYKDYYSTHPKALWRNKLISSPDYVEAGQSIKALTVYFNAVAHRPFAVKKNMAYLLVLLAKIRKHVLK